MDASPTPDHRWIDTHAGLRDLATSLAEAPWVALDSESNSAHVYRERVCLLQFNCGGQLFVVDTLALGEEPTVLDPLRASLEDPGRTCYLHGGAYDVICLKRSYGLTLRGIFDSQQASSLLGWPQTGYAAVVERCCGVHLDKAYSQYDWGTRPIDPQALRYALDDVLHLPAVCQHLAELVAAADLVDEVAEANRAVEEAEPRVDGYDPANLWRIKGIHRLPRRCLPLLTGLYAWRDDLAAHLNLPPGRVLNNAVLLVLASEAPTALPQLKRLRLKSWFLRKHGADLIACIERCLEHPPEPPPRPRQRQVDPGEEDREQRLKSWRKGEAQRRGVPLQVVLPAKSLEHLKRHGLTDFAQVPQLGHSRSQRYGATLRKLLQRS